MELKVLQRNFYDLKTGSGSTFGCTLYTLKSWIQTEIRSGSSTLNFQCSTVKIHSIDCVNICSSHNWLVRWVEAINYKTISPYRLQLLTTLCAFWCFLKFSLWHKWGDGVHVLEILLDDIQFCLSFHQIFCESEKEDWWWQMWWCGITIWLFHTGFFKLFLHS